MSERRVLHLHFGTEGGAERFFVSLAQALAERGVAQRFVIRPGRSWLGEVAALGPVIQNNYRRVSLSSLFLTWRVNRLVREWRPTAIMAWMPRASRLMPDYGGAVKTTRLGDLPRHLQHFSHCDVLVSNSPPVVERCRELGWTRPIRLISNFPRDVVPVAIDRASLDTPRDAFVVVGVGRFTTVKCFDLLVRAVAKLPGAWLWLVGDGEERAALEALVAELGMSDRTRFAGWVTEPMHTIAAASVSCLPSRHEVLGNVILESWQAGVPVVSTRTPGPAWVVDEGENGLLCPVEDVEALAAAIGRVRDDKGLSERLVLGGRRKLAAQFAKHRVVDQYCAVFDGQI